MDPVSPPNLGTAATSATKAMNAAKGKDARMNACRHFGDTDVTARCNQTAAESIKQVCDRGRHFRAVAHWESEGPAMPPKKCKPESRNHDASLDLLP